MTSRGTASRFLRSVLQNGVGRYVCQLKRITITFSKNAQSSLGVREFIEDGIPKIVAEYLNGNVREETVTSKTAQQISELVTKLTNQSGLDIIRIRKPFHTDNPSIQGQWHAFTNRPPSIGPIKPQKQDPQ
ncbi:hypothetical protein Q5P01_023609 [Channa striata]|uniref:Large ribosomal subunit protein mL43 n=1 Tax=Channa striata TaxID=64152 RepID=A0AA88IV56_CHASR|nr:hypothetical protein Q5P01_023609 [Channa striata]